MPKPLLLIRLAAFITFATCLIVGGCGYPKHLDPPLRTEPLPTMALLAAQAQAKLIGGTVYLVPDTHSMEPLLRGGDYIVVDSRVAYVDVKLGQIVNHLADWQPKGPTVTHRALVRDKDGLLVGGDNVDGQHPENKWRVTATNYRGVVDSIYRTNP